MSRFLEETLILDRIKEAYSLKSNAKLAAFLGIPPTTLSSWYSRNSFDLDLIYEKCVDIDLNWLLTGEGTMFRSKEPVPSVSEKKRHLIPLFDVTAIGGRQYDADMTAVSAPSEMIDTGDWFQDATAAMRVQGDSMSPEYKSGSIVALRQINDQRIIMYGEDYVVETDELRVIKRLQRADDPAYLMACSVNQEQWESGPMKGHLIHEPFEIPRSSIRRLFLVLGEVRRNHSCNIIDVVK